MNSPQLTRQPDYNQYPTLPKNSPTTSLSSTLASSSENDLLSGSDNGSKKTSNKKRRRVKRKRRPSQKKRVITKVYQKLFFTINELLYFNNITIIVGNF